MSFFRLFTVVLLILSLARISAANYLGADVETFSPASDQLDLITVQSGHTLKKGWWSTSLFGTYSQNNLLVYATPIENQIKQKPNDTLFATEVDMVFGLTPHVEWGLSLPMYLNQTVSNDLYRKLYIQRGLVSVRNHIKYSLADVNSRDGAAFIFTLDMPNVANDPYIGKMVRPIVVFEVAYDIRSNDSTFAVNGGFKKRQPSDMVDQATMWPLGDELIYSMGWAQRFFEKSALSYVLEVNGSSPVGNSIYKNASEISTLEGIVGLKGMMKSFSTWNLGAGFKLLPDSMSPDLRVFVGYSWSWPNSHVKRDDILITESKSFIPRVSQEKWREQLKQIGDDDEDQDGVPDDRDECPGTPPGIPVDAYGCPFDSDGDGVYDYEDKCPNTPNHDIVDRWGCSIKY